MGTMDGRGGSWLGAGVFLFAAHCAPAGAPVDEPTDPTTATATAEATTTAGAATAEVTPAPVTSSPAESATTADTSAASTSQVTIPTGIKKPKTKEECFELWKRGVELTTSARAKDPRKCKSDADCGIVTNSMCNFASCGNVMSAAGAREYLSTKQKIEAAICTPFHAAPACKSAPIPIPSCPMVVAACKDGRCTRR